MLSQNWMSENTCERVTGETRYTKLSNLAVDFKRLAQQGLVVMASFRATELTNADASTAYIVGNYLY